jgi:hypothetical protein
MPVGKEIKFSEAKADFVQPNFTPEKVIDGKERGDDNGWAIDGGPVGTPHWLTLKFDKPASVPEGGKWVIRLHQNYGGKKHLIGRFRLWVTEAGVPLEEGLPAEAVAALSKPPIARSEAENRAVSAVFERSDIALLKLKSALSISRRPVPPDAALIQLEAALLEASKPVPDDPALVRLRKDLAASERQIGARRLTFAQDVAWALINSSAFLFNY